MSMHSLQILAFSEQNSFLTSFCDFPQKEQRSVVSLASARSFPIAGDGTGGSGALAPIRRRSFRLFGKVIITTQLTAFSTVSPVSKCVRFHSVRSAPAL